MRFHRNCRLVVILSPTLFGLSAQVEAQHKSEIALDLRTMTVQYRPTLQADDPAHRMLLSPTSGFPDGHVRVGRFETDASVCIGGMESAMDGDEPASVDTATTACLAGVEIAVDEPEAVSTNSAVLSQLVDVQYDLWLAATHGGWSLHVADVQEGAVSGPSEILGTVQLAHTTAAVSSPTFIAGLVPTASHEAQLVLRWGRHEWTTDIQFSRLRETRPTRRTRTGDERTFAFDTAEIQRSNRLGQRNMATVWLPDGPRLSVVYGRNMKVENRDFSHLVSVATDMVVTMTASAVIRLDIDVPLQFGDFTLDTGNIGLRGSPGGYGVWLGRAADGWRFVFNDEPDAWGTQHNPEFDAGQVDAQYRQSNLVGDSMNDSSRAMSASVVMTTPDQGRFLLVWGPHEWTADFAVAR